MRTAPAVLLAVVVAVLAWGFWALFRDRMGAGDIYPNYSSLRADPLGTRAFFDSLSDLPGITVGRSVESPTAFVPGEATTHLYIGMSQGTLESATSQECLALDKAVRTGARVVIAMAYQSAQWAKTGKQAATDPAKAKSGKTGPSGKPADKAHEPDKDDEVRTGPIPVGALRGPGYEGRRATFSLKRLWGFTIDIAGGYELPTALSTGGAPRDFPYQLDCQTALSFRPFPEAGWKVLYAKVHKPIVMEREIGRGSVVLIADPYFLTNEALQQRRAAGLLSWVVGPNRHVVFQEDIHGGAEEGGIMAMARHFGFTEALLSLLVLALAYVWSEVSVFVPAPRREQEVILAIAPTAGLNALLRRAESPAALFKEMLGRWRSHASPADRSRLDKIPGDPNPLSAYNSTLSALKRR